MVFMNKKLKVMLIYLLGVVALLIFFIYGALWRSSIQSNITLSSSCSLYSSQIENSTSVYVTVFTSFFNINQINATETKLCQENPNNNFNKEP